MSYTFNEVRALVKRAIDKLEADLDQSRLGPRNDEAKHIIRVGDYRFELSAHLTRRKVFGKYSRSYLFVELGKYGKPVSGADRIGYSGISVRRRADFQSYLLQAVLTRLGITYHTKMSDSRAARYRDLVIPGPRPERPPTPDALPPVAAIIDSKDTPPIHTTAYQDTRSRQTGVPVEQLEKEMQEADPDYRDPIGRLARYMDERREAGLDSRELAEELLTAMGLAKGGPMHLVNLLDKGMKEEAVTDGDGC